MLVRLMESPVPELLGQSVVSTRSSEGIGRSQHSHTNVWKSFSFWVVNLSLSDIILCKNWPKHHWGYLGHRSDHTVILIDGMHQCNQLTA